MCIYVYIYIYIIEDRATETRALLQMPGSNEFPAVRSCLQTISCYNELNVGCYIDIAHNNINT